MKNPTWDEFKNEVLRRLQPTLVENPFEILLSLKQEGTVKEYRKQFEVLLGPLKVSQL